jgi:hypothetical protein
LVAVAIKGSLKQAGRVQHLQDMYRELTQRGKANKQQAGIRKHANDKQNREETNAQ